MSVEHRPEEHRFVLATDAGEAYLSYREQGGTYDLRHTVVPPAARGRGVGNALVEGALAQLCDAGARIVPSCPFVESFIAERPEYEGMVASSE